MSKQANINVLWIRSWRHTRSVG